MSAIGPFIQGPHSQNEIFSSRFSAPLKTRRSEILASLAADTGSSVTQFHLGVAEAYRRLGEKLLRANENGEEARIELGKLIDRVDFIPIEGLGKHKPEVHGSVPPDAGKDFAKTGSINSDRHIACDSEAPSPLRAVVLQRRLLQLPTGNMEPRFCDAHRIWSGRLDKIAVDFAA